MVLDLLSKSLLLKIGLFIVLGIFTFHPSTAEARNLDALEANFTGYRLDWGNVDPHGSPYTLPNAMSVTVTLSDRRQGWSLYVTANDDFRSSIGQTFPIERLEVAAHLPEESGQFKKCSTSPVLLIEEGRDMLPAIIDYRLTVGHDTPASPGGILYETELIYSVTSGYLNTTYSEPAPFDPEVHDMVDIHFYLREAKSNSRFDIYDSANNLVHSRVIPYLTAGWQSISWDGKTDDGEYVPRGLYYFQLGNTYPWPVMGYISVETGAMKTVLSSCFRQSLYAPEISVDIDPLLIYPGDFLRCQVHLSNPGKSDMENVRLVLTLPDCAEILAETITVDGLEHKAGTDDDSTVSISLDQLAAGEEIELSFQIAVNRNARPGKHRIAANITSTIEGKSAPWNEATSYFHIASQRPLRQGMVTGKVFLDTNDNGIMDPDESPLKGIRLALDDSHTVHCDSTGAFLVRSLIPGDYLLRVVRADLPQGYVPSFSKKIVSVAPGQVARIDIPVVKEDKESPSLEKPGSSPNARGSIKMEANPYQFSWSAKSDFTDLITDSVSLSLGLRSKGDSTAITGTAYGKLAIQLGQKTQLVIGSTLDPKPHDENSTKLSMTLRGTPSAGLSLGIGHDGRDQEPWLFGNYDRRITDTISLNTHLRLAHEGLTPKMTVTYHGSPGFVWNLSYTGGKSTGAEVGCSIPIMQGLKMKAVHRWTPKQGFCENNARLPVSDLGLTYYSQYRNLALGVDYSFAHGSKSSSLSLSADANVRDLYHISVKTSTEPRSKATSLGLTALTPRFGDGIITVNHEISETENSTDSILSSTTDLAGSFRLGELQDVSISYLAEAVDLVELNESYTKSSLVTRKASLHLDHRVTSNTSMGIGIIRISQGPKGAVWTNADFRAIHDVNSIARLVLGISCPISIWSSGHELSEEAYGPYVRFILTGGN